MQPWKLILLLLYRIFCILGIEDDYYVSSKTIFSLMLQLVEVEGMVTLKMSVLNAMEKAKAIEEGIKWSEKVARQTSQAEAQQTD